ncbi:MAG: sulfatase [Planctomycetia bacterium]|nr:sulfatase [Planctomycetia bacterium]
MINKHSALAAALVLLSGVYQAIAAPKNVVLVVADDLGPDLGCYGNRVIKTSNLDQLAAEGTRFTHAFCTTASCSPSRSVILSGLYNHATGQYGLEHSVHHFRTFDEVKTLSARLADAHYRTARAGKFHVGPNEVYPFDRVVPGNARNAVEMADHCRDVIAAADERPFFLYFCTSDPHRGGRYGPPPNKPNLFGNEGQYSGVTDQRYDPKDVIVPSFLPDTPICRAELAQYYQSASRVDQGVGRLIQVLKESGHWNDTLVIFISDNGIPFPGAKTTVYDPGLRLPCLVRNPYLSQRGVQSEAMVSWVDIAPTILDFAGVLAQQTGLQGRSFLGAIEQRRPAGWDEIYGSHTFHEVTMYYPMRAVRTRQYKLIWNIAHPLPFPFASDLWRSPTWQDVFAKGPQAIYGKRTVAAYINRPRFELYDLEQDPDELQNLASDPRHAATVAQLKAKIKAFQQRTKDPWMHKWEYE